MVFGMFSLRRPLDYAGARPVPREVEERAGAGKPAQLARTEVALETRKHEGSHAPDVYPRAQDANRDYVLVFGQWFNYVEFAKSHSFHPGSC